MSRRTIAAWFVIHKWSSLGCTLFLLMLCVTGLPLIFHDEIDHALDPPAPMRALPTGTPLLDLDSLLARVMADRPGEVPLYISFDEDRPAANVTTAPRADAPATAMHFVSVDRRSGETLPPHGTGFMDLLMRIHTDLLLGLPAELFLGAMGVLFFVAIMSGVVLYAPFMARLRFGTVRSGRSARVRRLDRHNLLGIVTVAWASVVGLTGTINTLAVPITGAWKAGQLLAISHSGAAPVDRPGRASVQKALDDAMRAAPGMRPQFIAFPGVTYSSERHYAVFLQGATPLTRRLLTPAFVDAASGRLDAVRPMPWYMQALLLAQPLHFGDYGGMAMKLLWALLDVVTIAVLVTGLRLWLGRASAPARIRVHELLSAGGASPPGHP